MVAPTWADPTSENQQQHHEKQSKIIPTSEAKGKGEKVETKWVDLFASGDFAAWSKVNGDPVPRQWTINDGIVFRGKNGGGSIITKKHYKDFELYFDWKISERGNSGVKYRTRGHLGLEYQVLDDDKHKDGKKPSHRTAALYNLKAADPDKPVNPVGEWNTGRIVMQGDQVEHWLNGKLVLSIMIGSEDWKKRFAKSKYRKHEGFGTWTGPILLQDHFDDVWYRNLRICEL